MSARLLLASLWLLALASATPAADDPIEFLQRFTTASAFDGAFRIRLSGTVDLEGYHIEQPAPGLIYTAREYLFNPRLTLFVDAQIGSRVYAFAQARVDRGFDPSDGGAQGRLDEYAVRVTPWADGRLSVQAGKFATVAGNWAQRHLSWDNPFITAPVPYGNLTGIWDSSAPGDAETLLYWAHVPYAGYGDFGNGSLDKPMRLPVVWGPSYATGVSVAGRVGKFDFAVEMKNAPLSSRPESWDVTAVNFDHPTFTGRLGFRPNQMWNLGVSASSGAYLLEEATRTLPPGRGIGDYRQQVVAQDVSFEWHHFQFWAEFYEARFEVPVIGNADTFAYYLEAKYKFAAQLFGALRWNQQLYSTIRGDEGERLRWGNDLWRIDAALGYRFSPHTQLKLQYSLQHEQNAADDLSSLLAAQFTLRF
jgi:hypothetical protein